MFSGSALLGSNLGNATMPGVGSLHQIREALHLQDVGQAREALQKPTTSQQKPQSRAIAGPCHLVQVDIPSRQCQPESDRVRSCPWAAPDGLSCPCWAVFAALAALSIQCWSRGRRAERVRSWVCPGGQHSSQWPGHLGPPHRGRSRLSELRRGRRCMARRAGHRPEALLGLSGAQAPC